MKEHVRPNGLVFVDKDKIPEINLIRRWGYPLGLYRQALGMVPEIQNPDKHAQLSWLMDSYWRERGSPNSLLTLGGLGIMYRLLSAKYPALDQPGQVILGKQQPSLLESTDATLKRLNFLYRYVRNLIDPYVSVVTGGSMSYGRFYNVREGDEPSDIDMIVVFNDGEETNLQAKSILPSNFGFNDDDVLILQERMRVFASLLKEGKADALSHTAILKSLGFSVSMHILPSSVFENMMVYDPHQDLRMGKDIKRSILDYKPNPFKHPTVRLNDFNGEQLHFSVNEEPVHNGTADNEVISQIPAHAIVKGSFVPGLYQNLLSPRFEMEAFSSRQCVAAATLFWSSMKKLESYYRQTNPDASALKSHIRYELFNPVMLKDHEN